MYTFTLKDMTCGHCEQLVTRTIKACDPEAQVAVDLAAHSVRIESSASEATLREKLAAAGYPAS
jgi:copper chaperone